MKIHKLLEHITSLAVVFLLLSATALWTGSLWGKHIGNAGAANTSAANAEKPAAASLAGDILQKLEVDAAQTVIAQRDSVSWTLSSADGKAEGVIISSKLLAGDVQGFAGPTPVFVRIGNDGMILAVAADANAETADFFHRAEEHILPLWKGHKASDAQSLKVDAVSGATYSSNALIANMQAVLSAYNASQQAVKAAPGIGWVRTLAVAVVLALGIAVSLWGRGKKWMRVAVLVLNVGVTGFWCGQFLSLTLLRGWVANGVNVLTALPSILLLCVAILMPLFGKKHHYCSWVCPYGSLQDLAGRLPVPKPHLSAKAYRVLTRVRLGIFCALMVLLWMGLGSFLLDYEPFTAFLVTTALPAVIVLAALFVVASIFIPNLWCKACCPMGELLNLAEDNHFTQNKNNLKAHE